jgi:hypothetical protein
VGEAAENFFPGFADKHTAGLWLFDETDYPYTTLTDAGECEYDLRLMKAGKLVPGKFGNALKVTPGRDYTVSYAAWKGAVGAYYMREPNGQPGSGLWGPTVAPERILTAMASGDWTCEFWLKLEKAPKNEVTIIDLGYGFERGFSLSLKAEATYFRIENAYGGCEAICPTESRRFSDKRWHHVAFTYCGSSGQASHFLDGQLQEPPEVSSIEISQVPATIRPESLAHTTYGVFVKKSSLETRRRNRFNFAIGHDRHGDKDLDASLDELRFSETIRYCSDFEVPGSFSRNYGAAASQPAVPTGPPLLFPAFTASEPVQLGSRKHLFIDDILVDKRSNIRLSVNPPADPQQLNEDACHDTSFFDHEGKVYMVLSDGYESDEGKISLLVSEDGVNFEKPDLGLIEYNGSKNNNLIMTHTPSWGRFFKDPNPNIRPEERFKFTGWIAHRGIYLYLSPNAIHWRRNETCMLPLVSGGGAETFWDDQCGCYVTCIKRDSSFKPGKGRRTSTARTREVLKTWPFKRLKKPYFEAWPFPAVTKELPVIFETNKHGQVFRSRAAKYEWAPDTYLAFVERIGETSKTDLGVSRDGANWKCYEDIGWYLPSGGTFEGRPVFGAKMADGMIRRGDQIWQYAIYTVPDTSRLTTVRLIQRLDGFVSLDAGVKTGTILMRPLVFEGERLVLNMAAAGYVRVGLTDRKGKPIPGFSSADCDPIKADSVRQVVTWNGDSDVSRLAGEVVRLQFEMRHAKLYALKFD